MNTLKYKKGQLKYLCSILGCKPTEIEYITTHVDEYYLEWNKSKIDPATGDYKRYKDGTKKIRTVRPSVRRLKTLQSAIKNKILSNVSLPPNVHGGVKGKNNISNAKPHQGKKYKFSTDLQTFFPSIKHSQVYSMFLSLGFSKYIANWLTKLTTWKHELPQGTPTSTHIANIVFLQTDEKLINLCKQYNLTYTRYVDDLAFSSDTDFRDILNDILKIITDAGYKISYRKTCYNGDPVITGIRMFNNYIDAPEKIIKMAAIEIINDSVNKPFNNYLSAIRKTNKKRSQHKSK